MTIAFVLSIIGKVLKYNINTILVITFILFQLILF